MVAAARGPESMVEMARSIERSPLRQAALETVRCDPVLVGLCADLRDADCRKRGAPVPAESSLRTLAGDLTGAPLGPLPRGRARGRRRRAGVRAGAGGAPVRAVRGGGGGARATVRGRLPRRDRREARPGAAGAPERWGPRRPGAQPRGPRVAATDAWAVGGPGRGSGSRRRGRARRAGPCGACWEGARRGSTACSSSPGPAAARPPPPSRRASSAWGTSGGPGRLQAAGLVLGGSRYLMAGLVRAGADPIAVAAASSRGAARAIAAGVPGSLADGARSSDHRRLVQVAEELDRRQRGAELTAATSAAARAARLDRWADCRGRRGAGPRDAQGPPRRSPPGDHRGELAGEGPRGRGPAVGRHGLRFPPRAGARGRRPGVGAGVAGPGHASRSTGARWLFDGSRTHAGRGGCNRAARPPA